MRTGIHVGTQTARASVGPETGRERENARKKSRMSQSDQRSEENARKKSRMSQSDQRSEECEEEERESRMKYMSDGEEGSLCRNKPQCPILNQEREGGERE